MIYSKAFNKPVE